MQRLMRPDVIVPGLPSIVGSLLLQRLIYPPVSGVMSAALFISNFQVGGIGL